jgi:D-alanyl-D-alanine carboxypeptidase
MKDMFGSGHATATLRVAVTVALAASLAAPAPALARRDQTDRVAGTALSKGEVRLDQAPDIDAPAGILVTSSGRELWSRRGSNPRAMASTTKMMTALLVLEHGELDRKVRISKAADRVPYGTGLRAGERVSVRRLLELTLVASSNDAAFALAQHVGGSVPSFVRDMNARADKLGLDDTHFVNPHGLDARTHRSSPTDLAKLAQKAMKNGEFRRIVKLRKVKLPAAKGRPARTLKSTDELLGVYDGLKGVKTGFTDNAKYTFVGYAERDGVKLTAVIMGARTNKARFRQTARLLDWGFKNLKVRKVCSAGTTFAEVPLASSPDVRVPVAYAETVSAPVFRLEGNVRPKPSLRPLEAPIFEGQSLGEVSVVQRGRELARVPAVAGASQVSVEETIGTVPVSNRLNVDVAVKTSAVASTTIEIDAAQAVDSRTELAEQVEAPVEKGTPLGEIVYSQSGREIVRVPILAAEAVEAPGLIDQLSSAVTRGLNAMLGTAGPSQAEAATGR